MKDKCAAEHGAGMTRNDIMPLPLSMDGLGGHIQVRLVRTHATTSQILHQGPDDYKLGFV